MLDLTGKPCTTRADLDAAIELLAHLRAADPDGPYPLVPRLRTLLLARLSDPAADARLWTNEADQPVGFAALTPPDPRGTYLPMALLAAPGQPSDALRGAMIGWAIGRARERAKATGAATPIALTVEADEADHTLQALLDDRGFTSQEVHIDYLARSLAESPAPATFPEGFTLRESPPVEELARDRDRYAPLLDRWSIAQRRELATSPDHDATLALVVDAPDGTLAAFCECSLARNGVSTFTPSTGAIDMIATRPDLRQRGIGRALLVAALGRLRAAGAAQVTLFTESTNPAQRLYLALGFRHTRQARLYTLSLPASDSAT